MQTPISPPQTGQARVKQAARKAPDIAATSVPDTLTALQVNPDIGLTHAEVDTRRKEHGYNEVAEKKEHPILKFLAKFWGISAWMLELIMVLSAVLGNYSDLAVVGALLVVNAALSFMQEQRAAGVVETLRKRLQVSARVRRDSSWQIVPARDLVPGDIVRVRPNHGTRRKHFAGRFVRVFRFASERRLVHAQLSSEKLYIRRDDVTRAVDRGQDLLWPYHAACPGGTSETSH